MKFLKNSHELSKLEVIFLLVIAGLLGVMGFLAWQSGNKKEASINSFAECAAAGNPIMESYPEQCSFGGQTWSNTDQSASDSSLELEFYEASEDEIAFTDFSSELQQAITRQLEIDCSADTVYSGGDILLSHQIAKKDRYVEDSHAEVLMTCGAAGNASLFAVKDSSWMFVAKAFHGTWPCDIDLTGSRVPEGFIDTSDCY